MYAGRGRGCAAAALAPCVVRFAERGYWERYRVLERRTAKRSPLNVVGRCKRVAASVRVRGRDVSPFFSRRDKFAGGLENGRVTLDVWRRGAGEKKNHVEGCEGLSDIHQIN